MVKRRTKSKTATHSKPSSYDHMMGSPMAANEHPVNSLPAPMGGLHAGTGLDMMAGSPNPSDYGV